MRVVQLLVVVLALLCAPRALAVQPDEVLTDATLETRARTLSRELRCMVCQNQSIDDSDASLARDLRVLVRERLTAGDSDRQVLDFLVARYGEFVLLKPRFTWHTVLLWSAPGAVLLAGAFGLVLLARRRRTQDVTADALRLTPAEQARLAAIGPAMEPGGDS
jgi:cytochrome c-type biogenesis protein CcmH